MLMFYEVILSTHSLLFHTRALLKRISNFKKSWLFLLAYVVLCYNDDVSTDVCFYRRPKH